MTLTRIGKLIACIVCVTAGNAVATPDAPSKAVDGWDFSLSANNLAAVCDATIAEAGKAFAALEKDTAPATVQSVYGPYNAIQITLQEIEYVWYMKAVHPDTGVQAAAEQCVTAYTDFVLAVNLSPAFYQRVAAIDLESASVSERFMIEKQLKAFHQAGVNRDRATRDKVRALTRNITDLGSTYEKAIRVDKRFVDTTPSQLAGLPHSVAGATVNRFCGSSMTTIQMAAGYIQMGAGDLFICAGVESMSRIPMGGFNPMPNPASVT